MDLFRDVLFWVFISFFVLIGVASLAVQLGFIQSGVSPAFRKWALASFIGAVTTAILGMFKMVFFPAPPPTVATLPSYSVALVFPATAPPPSLHDGSYEYEDADSDSVRSHTGVVVPTLGPGGWIVKLPGAAADKSVRLTLKDRDGKSWEVKDPFYPNYIAKNIEAAGPTTSGASDARPTFGVAVLMAAEPGRELTAPGPAVAKFNNWARPLDMRSGQNYYEWRLFVDEPSAVLNAIRQVDYVLHPTFPDPFRTSQDRDKNFELVASGWGTFTVLITIHYTDGRDAKTTYDLDFHKAWPTAAAPSNSLAQGKTFVEAFRDGVNQAKAGKWPEAITSLQEAIDKQRQQNIATGAVKDVPTAPGHLEDYAPYSYLALALTESTPRQCVNARAALNQAAHEKRSSWLSASLQRARTECKL